MKNISRKREAEIVNKYADILIQKLEHIKETRNLSEFCRDNLKNISPSRIYEFLNGKKITAQYMSVFMDAEVITLKELLREKALSDLPKDEQIVLKRLTIKPEIVDLICFLEERGVDVTQILRGNARAWYDIND